MDITIRTAQKGDARGIAKVHVETWRDAYKDQIPDEVLRGLSIEERAKMWEEAIAAADPAKSIFVALRGEEVVGFCAVGPSRDKDMPEHGELAATYISPSFQGQGIGSRLMEAGMDFLRSQGYPKAMLWVLKTNQKTIEFYKKHGWQPDGAEKKVPKGGAILHESRYTIVL